MRSWRGAVITSRGSPASTITPASMNTTRRRLPGEAHLVGDHHHGHAVGGELAHDGEHLADHFRVERGGRFVEQHELRMHGQRAGDRHPLLLAAGQLRRIASALSPRPTRASSSAASLAASSLLRCGPAPAPR